MRTFEFWRERGSGLVYAVALEDGVVVGASSPVDRDDLDDELLVRFEYDDRRAPWIEAHREDFDLYRQAVSA